MSNPDKSRESNDNAQEIGFENPNLGKPAAQSPVFMSTESSQEDVNHYAHA